MLPAKRSAVFLLSLCLAVASVSGVAQAQTNPLCPTRGHGTTLCPDLGSTGGDVFNPYYNPRVRALQGAAISPLGPLPGQFFQFTGGLWTPVTFTPTGDVIGTYPNFTVAGIRTFPVDPTAPTFGQVLQWDGAKYLPSTIQTYQDIFLGGKFDPPNDPLVPLIPQYIGVAGAQVTMAATAGVLVKTPRTVTNYTVGTSTPYPGGQLVFDLYMSIDDGATYSLVTVAAIPPGFLVKVQATLFNIPANARLLTRVTANGILPFLGGLSATTSP